MWAVVREYWVPIAFYGAAVGFLLVLGIVAFILRRRHLRMVRSVRDYYEQRWPTQPIQFDASQDPIARHMRSRWH